MRAHRFFSRNDTFRSSLQAPQRFSLPRACKPLFTSVFGRLFAEFIMEPFTAEVMSNIDCAHPCPRSLLIQMLLLLPCRESRLASKVIINSYHEAGDARATLRNEPWHNTRKKLTKQFTSPYGKKGNCTSPAGPLKRGTNYPAESPRGRHVCRADGRADYHLFKIPDNFPKQNSG